MEKNELTEWQALYEIGLKIKALAPWEFTATSDVYTLLMPTRKLPVYLNSIHEGTQESFIGIGIHSTMPDITDLYHFLMQDYDSYTNALAEKSGLFAVYGSRKDMFKANHDLVKELGYRFRGDGNWLQFVSFVRGMEPWQITRREVRFMTRCLKLFYDALILVKTEQIIVDFNNFETLITYYDESLKKWQHMVGSIDFPEGIEDIVEVEILDSLLIERLKQRPKTNQIIEVASFFLSTLVKENKSEQGMVPKLCLLVDHHSEMILANSLTETPDDEIRIVVDCVIDYLSENKRPKKLIVAQEDVYHYLLDLCTKVGITLTMEKELPAMDEIFAKLS